MDEQLPCKLLHALLLLVLERIEFLKFFGELAALLTQLV